MTADGPQFANLAFRSGAQQGEKLGAVDDLKRSQANRAVAIRAPVNLPTWNISQLSYGPSRKQGRKKP